MKDFYIDFIADYGKETGYDDLAFSEVNLKLSSSFVERDLNFPLIKNLSVNPFNTIETGFVVAQLGFNSLLGKRHIIYHNTAPRKDFLKPRIKNEGENLAVAELPNKVKIIGVWAGYSFSFVHEVSDVFLVKCLNKGSQFRSRDIFPEFVASLASLGDKKLTEWEFLGEKIEKIESVPENRVLSVDGYGNIKTNLNLNKEFSKITLNGITKEIKTGEGIFDTTDGQLIVAPGSSGFEGRVFSEICLRGGKAVEVFNFPKPGTQIQIK